MRDTWREQALNSVEGVTIARDMVNSVNEYMQWLKISKVSKSFHRCDEQTNHFPPYTELLTVKLITVTTK